MKTLNLVTFFFVVFFCSSCINDTRLERALNLAGDNRSELLKVLNHFQNNEEKEKAARFLIYNMIYHYTEFDKLFSPVGNSYDLHFDHQNLKCEFDSLVKSGYILHNIKYADIENIKSDYLIENIDLAFAVWKRPWANKISFDNFCQYILPYRSNEELLFPGFRRQMMDRYLPYLDSLKVTSPLEACEAINKKLIGQFKFLGTLPLQPSLKEVDQFHVGNCNSISSYVTFLMRSLGIPVAQDITVWTKSGYGHSWCSVLELNGQWHPFAPTEALVEEYSNRLTKGVNLPAKVYRSLFEPFSINCDLPDDEYLCFLKDSLYKDVTNMYDLPTTTISIKVDDIYKKQKSFVYLCAYNMGKWKEVALGKRIGNYCIIRNIVGDNIFRIAISDHGILRYLTDPFYVDFNGKKKLFSSDLSDMKKVVLRKNSFYGRFRHWGGYWDATNHLFRRVSTIEETDSTLVCFFPNNSLMVMGTRWVNWQQRIYFLKGDSVYKY